MHNAKIGFQKRPHISHKNTRNILGSIEIGQNHIISDCFQRNNYSLLTEHIENLPPI